MADPANQRTVTTSATGTAAGAPDLLRARISVSSRGTYAADVLADANARMRSLLEEIASIGVAPADVTTSHVSLGPAWDREHRPDGYEASNAVDVVLRDLATAGADLDALARLVGDHIRLEAVHLDIDDDTTLRSEARQAAVRLAQRQATELATAAGAELGPVRSITEGDDGHGELVLRSMAVADLGVPLSAGTHEVSTSVRVVFDLR
jgi:uncharacterized protein YggE